MCRVLAFAWCGERPRGMNNIQQRGRESTMTDVYVETGDLERLRRGGDEVADGLAQVRVGDEAGYLPAGMVGSDSASVVMGACNTIDGLVEGVAEALRDYSSNVGETIAQFVATEDANTVMFQNVANSAGVN